MITFWDTPPSESPDEIGSPIPFHPNMIFPFLTLPLEIRLKIYRYLFRSTIPFRPIIPKAEEYELLEKIEDITPPAPSKPHLPINFLLVCRQIHNEASQMLWSSNQFLLQFPLQHEEIIYKILATKNNYPAEGEQEQNAYDRGIMPSPTQLQQIRDLILEIYLSRDYNQPLSVPAHLTREVASDISLFLQHLAPLHQLQNLEIRFTNIKTRCVPTRLVTRFEEPEHGQMPPREVGAAYPAHWTPRCCGWWGGRVFGEGIERVGQIQGLCRGGMRVDGRVLRDLGDLRGVRGVEVKGRVEEAWGEWLRGAISSEEGVKVEPYVEAEVGLDGLAVV